MSRLGRDHTKFLGYAEELELYFKCYGKPHMKEGRRGGREGVANAQMPAYLSDCRGTQYLIYLKYIVCPKHQSRDTKIK